MIDMQGIVLADTIQQAERNLQELDSVAWAEYNGPKNLDQHFIF